MNLDLPDFAVRGARGVDIFRRREDPQHRRARYTCLATVLDAGTPPGAFAQALRHADGRLMLCHSPGVARQATSLWAAADRLAGSAVLNAPIRLGDATSYPAGDTGGDTGGYTGGAELFAHIEFLRERLLADMTLTRFQAALQAAPGAAAAMDGGDIAGPLRLALDFNMTRRGAALTAALQPLLVARATTPDLPTALVEPTGYALRLLGDLRLRAGDAGAAAQALALFQAALTLGENPFRRRRVIEAAAAAARPQTALAHLQAWPAKPPLPDDLRALGDALTRRLARQGDAPVAPPGEPAP